MRTKSIFLLGSTFLFIQGLFAQGWTDAGTVVHNSTNTDKIAIGCTTVVSNSVVEIRTYQAGSAVFSIGGTSDAYPRLYMGGTSTSVAGLFIRNTTGATIYMGEDTDTGGFIFRGKGAINIGSGRLYMNSIQGGSNQGAVGIGTTDPKYKLHVIGTSRIATATGTASTVGYIDLLAATGSSNPTSIEIMSGGTGSNNNVSQIDFKGSNNSSQDYQGRIKHTDGTGFDFYTNHNSTSRFTITEGGLVGIGTTPASGYVLDVVGSYMKFEYNSANFVKISTVGGQINLCGSGGGFYPTINFTDDYDVSSTLDCQINYTDADGLSITTGGTGCDFRIQTDGRVVIGNPSDMTTDLSPYMLFVETGIITERLKVALRTSVDWADYVFSPDYKLLSLDSVQNFTKANCHLPGMPSADDLVKEGIDVANMDALLLRQIEELWLQLFLLKKENEELKLKVNKN